MTFTSLVDSVEQPKTMFQVGRAKHINISTPSATDARTTLTRKLKVVNFLEEVRQLGKNQKIFLKTEF